MTFAFGKILFAVFLLFFAINSVLGLYKLQPEKGKEGKPNLLVEEKLAKKDYIYLYQFNRTSFAPTQAALNQFIEGLLILMGVKFHRIPNQFFLGSQSTGAAPFIQFKGRYYDGVNEIMEFLKKNFKNEMRKLPIFKHKIAKLATFNKDKEVQDFALDFSFKVLMKDRSRRPNKEEGNKASTSIKTIHPFQKSMEQMTEEELKATSEMEGLDFMLYDQGIREQLFPAVPGQLGQKNLDLLGEFTLYELSRKFLTAYFNAAYDGGKRNAKEIEENVPGLKLNGENENWDEFEKYMETYITNVLNVVLISNNGNSSEEKLKPLLQNAYGSIFGRRPYAKIDEAELYNIFMKKLIKLKIISTLDKTKKFLTGGEPSIADMALFSILEQFFETPLNIPEFKQLFQPERLNDNDNTKLNKKSKKDKDKKYAGKNVEEIRKILKSFYEQMKEKLGVGKERWTMLTQKPWPLNYENIWREEYSDKFDGPYIIETDELNNLQNVENSDSEIKNERESMLAEVVNEVKEKAKEIFAKENEKDRNLTEKKLVEMMLAETAAYLCNLGPGKDSEKGKECRAEHEKNYEEITYNIQMKTRKVVYGTIVDFNDRLVRDKVTMETGRVAGMLKNDSSNVAKYSSSLKIGNEY